MRKLLLLPLIGFLFGCSKATTIPREVPGITAGKIFAKYADRETDKLVVGFVTTDKAFMRASGVIDPDFTSHIKSWAYCSEEFWHKVKLEDEILIVFRLDGNKLKVWVETGEIFHE